MRKIVNTGLYDAMKSRPDEMGNLLKSCEQNIPSSGRFQGGKPLVVRLDGSGFSKYTKDLDRPFDMTFRQIMVDVCNKLVERFHADLYYTQSDEITLVWFNMSYIGHDGFNNTLPFNGRYQKIVSETAGFCTAIFNQLVNERLPLKSKTIAYFDSRAYQPSSDDEALLSVKWRIYDNDKNAVNQCLHYLYPNDKQLLIGMNGKQRRKLLHSQPSEVFDWNNYPTWIKTGTLMYKTFKLVDKSNCLDIPEQFRPTSPIRRVDWVDGNSIFRSNASAECIMKQLYERYLDGSQ